MIEAGQAPTWAELSRRARAATGDATTARWLLEELPGCDCATLRRAGDGAAPPAAGAALEAFLARLAAGEPLQHVLGHWSFRTLDLLVDRRALVPRPETEVVVEQALAALRRRADLRGPRPGRPAGASTGTGTDTDTGTGVDAPGRPLLAADLGTGGGAIACSLVAELDELEVHAVDASPEALSLAAANAARLPPRAGERLHLHRGDWYVPLAPLAGRLDLVVANPPYLAEGELATLDPVVRDHEPRAALVAGPSGLEAHEAVIGGAPDALAAGGYLVVEIAPAQAGRVLELAAAAGAAQARVERDLAGRERVLVARF